MDEVAAVLLRIVNRSNRKRIIVFEGWIERTSLMYDGHQLNDIMNSTTSKIFNDDEEQTQLLKGGGAEVPHGSSPMFTFLYHIILLSIERYWQPRQQLAGILLL